MTYLLIYFAINIFIAGFIIGALYQGETPFGVFKIFFGALVFGLPVLICGLIQWLFSELNKKTDILFFVQLYFTDKWDYVPETMIKDINRWYSKGNWFKKKAIQLLNKRNNYQP